MPPGRAAVALLSSPLAPREDGACAGRALLDGSFPLPLRRHLRTPTAEGESLWVDHCHPAPDRSRARGLAGELLHLWPTGAAGQLPHPAKAPQDRATETFST